MQHWKGRNSERHQSRHTLQMLPNLSNTARDLPDERQMLQR